LETLVRVAGQRWQIEQTFQAARANADWIATKFATGKAGIGTSLWLCGPTRCWPFCARKEKKTPGAQVPLSVPELRHLLTHLLRRGLARR
jgi:hypothetical protein